MPTLESRVRNAGVTGIGFASRPEASSYDLGMPTNPPGHAARLFVPEGVERVEPRGAPRRAEAGDD